MNHPWDRPDAMRVPALIWSRNGVEVAGLLWLRLRLRADGHPVERTGAEAAPAPGEEVWLVEAKAPPYPGVFLLLAHKEGWVELLAEGRDPTPAWWDHDTPGGAESP